MINKLLELSDSCNISGLYYDKQTVEMLPSSMLNSNKPRTISTAIFSGWDFVNVWDPCSTNEYPACVGSNPCGGTSNCSIWTTSTTVAQTTIVCLAGSTATPLMITVTMEANHPKFAHAPSYNLILNSADQRFLNPLTSGQIVKPSSD